MPPISMRRAVTDDDVGAFRSLCRARSEWRLKVDLRLRDVIVKMVATVADARLLADLPQTHARAGDTMMPEHLNRRPIGCVMHEEMPPGVAEAFRG